jgi:hypothetical protein
MALTAWEEHGWPLLVMVSIAGLLIASALVRGIISAHSRENWLLKDCGDLLLINLRLEGEGHRGSSSEAGDIVLLRREEISEFSVSSREYVTAFGSPLPGEQPTAQEFRFLDIRLVHENTGEILAAVAERRRERRDLPSRVVVPKAGIIRLHWESPLGAISPGLKSAITILSREASSA